MPRSAKPDLRARLHEIATGRAGTQSDIDPDLLAREEQCFNQLHKFAHPRLNSGQALPLASELLPPLP